MSTDDLRSTLFGSRLRIAVVVLVLLGVAVAAAVAAGILAAPSVTGVDNRFGGVNESTTVIESDLAVRNPNPVGVTLGGLTVDYAVSMNDIRMAEGKKNGVSLPKGESTLPFTTYMSNDRIPAWWVSHVSNGERTVLRIDADVHSSLVGASYDAPQVEREIETNLVGAFNSTETRPIDANKEPLVQDPVLYINETSGSWGNVTEETTRVQMQLVVTNPKSYPVHISEIGYDITMNDVEVGSGATDRSYTIPPGETTTIEATTVIRNDALDEWWVSHLERNQVTELRLAFYLRFDLSSVGGGSVRVPLDDMTQRVETDIFDNKAGDGADGGDGGANETGGDDGTPTATPTPEGTTTDDGLIGGDETATPTPTPTPTATPTSTPTPTPTPEGTTTDDGGLLDLPGTDHLRP